MQAFDDENAESGRQGVAAGVGFGKKMYYSISEACAMTGVEPHALRYWEKEFSLLRPKKNSGGRRAYTEKDIEAILRIKRMLEEEKYTLQGAKDKLSDERRERRAGGNAAVKKREKNVEAAERGGLAPAGLSAAAIPISAEASAGLTKTETVTNDGDRALILSMRDELLGILGLLDEFGVQNKKVTKRA
jgi:DNA-binding transcriptional MerR regulator